jgi:hypothetical protein
VLEFHTRAYVQHLQSSNLRVPTPTLGILRWNQHLGPLKRWKN